MSPPWSLRLFGETRGIAKIRLEPASIGWPTAMTERQRLAALFPEAQVWIAPRDPGEPDPLDDDPQLSATWAAELKIQAIRYVARRDWNHSTYPTQPIEAARRPETRAANCWPNCATPCCV